MRETHSFEKNKNKDLKIKIKLKSEISFHPISDNYYNLIHLLNIQQILFSVY